MQEVSKTFICWRAQPPVSGWALCPIGSHLLGEAAMLAWCPGFNTDHSTSEQTVNLAQIPSGAQKG